MKKELKDLIKKYNKILYKEDVGKRFRITIQDIDNVLYCCFLDEDFGDNNTCIELQSYLNLTEIEFSIQNFISTNLIKIRERELKEVLEWKKTKLEN